MTWLDGWPQRRGNDAGTWASGPRHPKLVLHTTEGGSITGAVGAYLRHNSWPHVTVDPGSRERVQHLPLDVPARSLRNSGTPGETNRAPTVVQVEIVGHAADTLRWSSATLDWLGAEVVGPICRAASIPLRADVTFYGTDAAWTLATVDARQRLTRAEWEQYEGILGHQHVPEQTHWDPGALDITRIITAASGGATPAPPAPPKGPLMALTDKEQSELLDRVRRIDNATRDLPAYLRAMEHNNATRETSTWARIKALASRG